MYRIVTTSLFLLAANKSYGRMMSGRVWTFRSQKINAFYTNNDTDAFEAVKLVDVHSSTLSMPTCLSEPLKNPTCGSSKFPKKEPSHTYRRSSPQHSAKTYLIARISQRRGRAFAATIHRIYSLNCKKPLYGLSDSG
ncbi:hypothetical protein BC829DRAFT_208767 [Chytridium lagenaria]|nr:hypothetical protein BC829DRAFT_208767 [Chytridium lagenaria]